MKRLLAILVVLLTASGLLIGPPTQAAAATTATQTGLVPLTPARLLDTRSGWTTADGQFNGTGRIGAAASTSVTVLGRGGVPASGVAAVVVNITGVGPNAATFLSAYPAGSAVPNASTLNLTAGQTAANLAVVKVGSSGQISLFNAVGTTDALVDVTGYYPSDGAYNALTPERLLDTRSASATVDGAGQGAGPVAGGSYVDVQVTGRPGIPASGVAAVVLNVTGIASGATFITAYPAGEARPNASTVNLNANEATPNLAVVKVGADGKVRLANATSSAHLIADVTGWIPTSTPYVPVTPARFLDTRSGGTTVDGAFARSGAIGAGQTLNLQVAGRGGVPTSALAVYVNVTAVQPSSFTYVSAYPTGASRPATSSLNLNAGDTRANLVLAKIGTSGSVSLYNSLGNTNVVADVVGYVGGADRSTASDPKLATRIGALMADSRVQNANVGTIVADADSALDLYTRYPDNLVAPASNMKVLTSTAALGVLGPDYRFKTVAYAQSAPVNGVVNGDLYLKGFGDPTVLESDLQSIAAQVKAAGITKVTGRLIADASFFDADKYNANWDPAWFSDYYAGQVRALTLSPDTDYDVGNISVNYTGATAGQPARLTVSPASAAGYVTLVNNTTTGAAGSADTVYADRQSATSNVIVVGGNVAVGASGRDFATVDNPALYALHAFRGTLSSAGVTVAGAEAEGTVPSGATTVGTDTSMTLREMMVPFLKLSINGIAEHLTKTMGRTQAGSGTWASGITVIKDWLGGHGVPMTNLTIVDGSGLSHSNRINARTVLRVLLMAENQSWFEAWYNALPIAGNPDRMVGGTLRNRMIGTPAQDNFHGKTGTLTGVTALSGYVTGKDGRHYVMSMISNYPVSNGSPRPVEDQLVVLLAGWTYSP